MDFGRNGWTEESLPLSSGLAFMDVEQYTGLPLLAFLNSNLLIGILEKSILLNTRSVVSGLLIV